MKFLFPLTVTLSFLLPISLPAQKKEVVELGRDVALLQDQVRTLQRTQDEKFAQLTILLQQAVDAAYKSNMAVTNVQTVLNDRFGEQNKQVGGTIAAIGNKVDNLADEYRGLREAIADLNARMGKLDAKLTDVSNAVRTLAASTPPPGAVPPAPTGSGSISSSAPPSNPPPSAQATYEAAYRDYTGGRLDLAIQEFQEYLKWFKQTELAPNAQFYIGDIYLRQNDTDNAIKAFDAVLEQYSEGNKTPDAHFMKARALFQAGQKTNAANEYCEVVRRYPNSDLANKAKSALRGMGQSGNCGVAAVPPAAAAKRTRRR